MLVLWTIIDSELCALGFQMLPDSHVLLVDADDVSPRMDMLVESGCQRLELGGDEPLLSRCDDDK